MSVRGVARSIKNVAMGFSEAQIQVREATSNDPWGPSGTIMNEIAQLTYNEHDFVEIMDMVDKRLNDKGRNWRHVFKALLLLDYLIHVGSDKVVIYAKENVHVIKTLKEFQHIDENGRDVGANVRQKAKDITSLLKDDARLKEERQSRGQLRDRMVNVSDYFSQSMGGGYRQQQSGNNVYDEERNLRQAIEESKRLAQAQQQELEKSDADLTRAIQISAQEAEEIERKKREKLDRENQENLFGSSALDGPTNPYYASSLPSQPTGLSNYTFNDPISINPWGNATTMQHQQMTGMPIQFTGQPTGLHQQQQQAAMSFPHSLPVATGMPFNSANSPYQQQHSSMMMGGSQPQTGYSTTTMQSSLLTGTPTLHQQQHPSSNLSSPYQIMTPPPSRGGINNPFGHQSPSNGMLSAQAATPTGQQAATAHPPANPQHAKLDALLSANRHDGQDTFGNTGNLRIPVGTGFANSLQPQPNSGGGVKSNSTSDLLGLTSETSRPTRNPFAPQPTGPAGPFI